MSRTYERRLSTPRLRSKTKLPVPALHSTSGAVCGRSKEMVKRGRESEKTEVENTGTRPVGSPGGSWWQSARNAKVDGDTLTAELQNLASVWVMARRLKTTMGGSSRRDHGLTRYNARRSNLDPSLTPRDRSPCQPRAACTVFAAASGPGEEGARLDQGGEAARRALAAHTGVWRSDNIALTLKP